MSAIRDSELVYVGDAMCSWCWGFAPVLDRLRRDFAAHFTSRLIVGGLRPGSFAEPLDDRLKTFLREEWSRIREVTGQPFDFAVLDRDSITYDTDPAARAVVAMRGLKPESAFAFFNAVQRAFYADNTDVTQEGNLAVLASPFGVDPSALRAALASADTRAATDADYLEARRLGVTGFPSVLVRMGERWGALTYGYQPYEQLAPVLEHVVQHGLPQQTQG